jgi:hypothetical protein
LQLFDQVNQAPVFVDTLIYLRKKRILDDVYLSDVTGEIIGEKTESVEKKIFFNLSPNLRVVRTTLIVEVTEVTHLTRMLAKNNSLL